MKLKLTTAALFLGAMLALPAAASTVTIDFESDGIGSVANGFVSNDSALVSFSDTIGGNLRVNDYGGQSDGRALAAFADDASQLQMDFTVGVSGLTMDFGNDDAGFSSPGDVAWLVGWLDGALVQTVGVTMNRDDLMNQSISLTTVVDQAFFYYGDAQGNEIGLIEIVDNISFAPIPLPAAGWMLLAGVGGLAAMRRRKKADA